ncbi:PstS family phosphate ABC transporter substrate-binding protein [Saccharothrix variisporea]|uniref:Phosphate transport system substrate-binding protein n=1 Tax=Saccharothrix variisporea TaxID=543527 RepID=A0A495X0S9_9PSEU|nr:substrate-binding domain-containing protein [Saccharothrix variisporea]RKT66855.1 phosphate transport system substrate-binding protein [Saccharothrix variisporea]
MLSDDPAARSRLRDLSRVLLKHTYPEHTDEEIEREVEAAEERFRRSGDPGAFAAEPAPPQELLDGAAPREPVVWSTGVRGLVTTAVVLAGLALTVLALTTAGAASRGVGGVLAVGACFAAVAAFVTHRRVHRTRLLSCRLRFDAPFAVDKGRAVSFRDDESADDEVIDDVSIVVARVKNTGRQRIDPDDYVSPLALHFPGRRVVSVDVAESEPENLANLVARMPDFEVVPGRDRVTLPTVALKPGYSFKVFIVLEGRASGDSKVEGRLRDGRITTKKTQRRTGPYTPLFAALTAIFLTGAVTAFLLPAVDRPADFDCVPGRLVVNGSTAFGATGAKLSGAYEALCPGAEIAVTARGSLEGLQRLNAARGEDRSRLLALSDVQAPREYADLRPLALAVVPFAIVVKADGRDVDLTTDQVRGIFGGTLTNWRDITGEDAPIHVVARSADSGTRRTLEDRLGVRSAAPTSDTCETPRAGTAVICERTSTADVIALVGKDEHAIGYVDVAGARESGAVKPVGVDGVRVTGDLVDVLRGGYGFWSVERVYRADPLGDSTLASAFVRYLRTPEAAEVMRQAGHLPCSDPRVADLCGG